ncbi:MAG: hypothetical protein H0X41_07115, partial [Chitinophagaceae bacterium]|nr:hypothetical protein [Chitinophagaceae bacterium]
MEINKRFTIMAFPQHFDGVNKLRINILFMPRSQNPFRPAIESTPPVTDPVPAFADAKMLFNAAIVKGLEKFPNTLNADIIKPAPAADPVNKKQVLATLADGNHFKIENKDDSNQILPENANKPRPRLDTIKKYLPLTYRSAFNFIAPVLKGNAVIDDSYHCAVRGAAKYPGFKQSPDTVSWGNVFAFILRNPVIAEAAGFIYKTEIEIDAADFSEGGWIHIGLADNSDYKTALTEENDFIKRYAARIPQLKSGEDRALFAANLFPVLLKNPGDLTDPSPSGNFDNIFIEAADYDDGFGKILHSFQPVSQHLLQEESDGFHPTHDSGIRLGWDDEQLLMWYVRQMAEDESVGTGKRIDAPTGVMGFHIDVKENGTAVWNPLNKVRTKDGVDPLGGLAPGNPAPQFTGELPFQVFPSTLDGDPAKNYWLPMYFANWAGHSMVLPNKEAIDVYHHEKDVQPDYNKADPDKKGKTNVTGSPANQLLKTYDPLDISTKLKYGSVYDFRIRYTDITNGGPALADRPVNEALHPETSCHFKRYTAPTTIRLDNVPANEDGAVYDLPSLKVLRPLLSYPSVVYTDRYTDAVARIISKMDAGIAAAAAGKRAQINDVGLSDPDADSMEITVEVQALRMDYQLSISGRESYSVLYKTTRNFNVPGNDDDYDQELEIPIEYRDAAVLKFGNTADLGDLGSNQIELDTLDQLVLPTARAIRLTIRAVCR